MNTSELAKQLWADVSDSVKDSLTNEQRSVCKESATNVAKFYLWSVTNSATADDHKAVKAIMANLKSIAAGSVAKSFQTTLERLSQRAVALLLAA